MRLTSLNLRNFKGLRHFDFEPNGSDANVFADNGVGKTTIMDAWTWLLFGKDSRGRATFDIKTIDPKTGDPKHKLEHTVAAALELEDGQDLTLEKTYREVWTKPRGAARDQFDGHTTDHQVNGVPVSKGEFDARVAELATEKHMRLLTDPTAFNEIHWTERRQLLLDVCGDVTDADVIASAPDLERIPSILDGRTLDERRKILAARRKEINQELDKLPVRIGEVSKNAPDLTGIEGLAAGSDHDPAEAREMLQARLAEVKERRRELEREKARIEAGGAIADKKRRLSEIETEISDLKRAATGQIDVKIRDAKAAAGAAADRVDVKARELRQLQERLEDAQRGIAKHAAKRDELRPQYEALFGEEFHHDEADTCAACGQSLPADQVAEAHAKAKAEWNKQKARRLEAIEAEGLEHKELQAKLEHQVADLQTAITDGEQELEQLQSAAEKAAKDAERLAGAAPDVTRNPKHQQLVDERAQVEAAITELQQNASAAIGDVDEQISAVDEQITTLQAQDAMLDQHERAQARIEELSKDEERLAEEFESTEADLFLLDEFTRAKVTLLTERINSRFELASFRLFKDLQNGGLDEDCTTTYQGVPWESLNHGARTNVGLDIIRTLQRHFGFAPPVFVDNAESVTKLIDMPCQVIRLVVSGADRKLRVETTREEVAA